MRLGWQARVVEETTFLVWGGSAWTTAGLPAFFSDAVFQLAHHADLNPPSIHHPA